MRSEVDIVDGCGMGGLGGCCLMGVMLNVVFRYESKLRHSAFRLRPPVIKPCNF